MSKLVCKGELYILNGVPTQTLRSSSRAMQEERKNWHQLKAFCLPNKRKENIAAVKWNISVRVGAGHKYGISNLVWVPVWRWLLLEDPRLRRCGFISRLSVVSAIWLDWCRFFFPLIFSCMVGVWFYYDDAHGIDLRETVFGCGAHSTTIFLTAIRAENFLILKLGRGDVVYLLRTQDCVPRTEIKQLWRTLESW